VGRLQRRPLNRAGQLRSASQRTVALAQIRAHAAPTAGARHRKMHTQIVDLARSVASLASGERRGSGGDRTDPAAAPFTRKQLPAKSGDPLAPGSLWAIQLAREAACWTRRSSKRGDRGPGRLRSVDASACLSTAASRASAVRIAPPSANLQRTRLMRRAPARSRWSPRVHRNHWRRSRDGLAAITGHLAAAPCCLVAGAGDWPSISVAQRSAIM
jgi:hypothetical protein